MYFCVREGQKATVLQEREVFNLPLQCGILSEECVREMARNLYLKKKSCFSDQVLFPSNERNFSDSANGPG